MSEKDSYGDIFFEDVKIIRHSRFSHYLIQNESILEINSMKSIAIGLLEITDMFDELEWGILYPVYKLYKEIRLKYRRFKHNRKYPNIKRLEETINGRR